jgi:hypothetical protein
MSDLYPTPTRLALLRAVVAGEIWQNSNGESVETDSDVLGVSDPVRRVTAAVHEQQRAGWIELVELKYGAKQWQLTDEGRAVLAGVA